MVSAVEITWLTLFPLLRCQMPSQKMETQFATDATEGRKSSRGCRTLTVNQHPGGRQRSTESTHLQLTAEIQNCYNLWQ